MTSKEFVLWFKGFTEGVHEFAITPKQWDYLKEKLAEVKDDEPIGFPFGVPNTAPIQTLPFIQPYQTDPYNPYKTYCTPGTTSKGTFTTTPGTGYITTYNPIQFGTGSVGTITTTPGQSSITFATPQYTTSTAYGYPSGSTMSYTTSNERIF
jgi:hypothetical protein